MTINGDDRDAASIPTTIGLADLARMIYHGADQSPLLATLTSRLGADPGDSAALMDLAMVAQLNGDRERGISMQSRALEINHVFRCVHGSGAALRVLALFAPGDFMANTPLDFLLDGSDVTVYYAYVTDGATLPVAAVEHDVAFLGVAESDANRDLLERLDHINEFWPRPVINADARTIIELKRDLMWKLFQSSQSVVAPRNVCVTRADLSSVAEGKALLGQLLPSERFPIIVRPLDSHAGQGLAKIDAAPMLRAYLAESDHQVFYVAPFVDYRSADGRFRKYRIVFISGRAFIVHLAISDDWMVHYLSAGMHDSAEKREEEAECMARFDADFGVRHRVALDELVAQVHLDYFAVDCAETRDGRLLLFEAGTGMIVHSLDSGEGFPYKQVQMKKIFAAFLNLLRMTADRRHGLAVPALPV